MAGAKPPFFIPANENYGGTGVLARATLVWRTFLSDFSFHHRDTESQRNGLVGSPWKNGHLWPRCCIPHHCHPERSRDLSRAKDLAESRDLLSASSITGLKRHSLQAR
jgi:hypothetical protein